MVISSNCFSWSSLSFKNFLILSCNCFFCFSSSNFFFRSNSSSSFCLFFSSSSFILFFFSSSSLLFSSSSLLLFSSSSSLFFSSISSLFFSFSSSSFFSKLILILFFTLCSTALLAWERIVLLYKSSMFKIGFCSSDFLLIGISFFSFFSSLFIFFEEFLDKF